MRFALLGADPDSLRLARAALAEGHELAWLGDASPADAAALRPAVALRPAEAWRDLLDDRAADAVILGRGSVGATDRSERLQELVRLQRPVLAVFPLVPDVLAYFVADMTRRERHALLWHFNPLRESAWWQWAQRCVAEGHPRLGPVQQVVAAREATDRGKDDVEQRFAQDVEPLDRVVGGLDRIGAHGADDQGGYAALAVHLVGRSRLPVRWSVGPPIGGPGLEVALVGERGREAARFDPEGRLVARWLETPAGRESWEAQPDEDPAVGAWRNFVAAFHAAPGTTGSRDDDWSSALHAMELTDSIEISLRKSRMIDVHQQQLTEHMAFKGTMAALGCGVLLAAPPLLLLAGWAAGLVGLPIAAYWPHALLALLAMFLAVQVVPKLL
jgi:hypothetical protein